MKVILEKLHFARKKGRGGGGAMLRAQCGER